MGVRRIYLCLSMDSLTSNVFFNSWVHCYMNHFSLLNVARSTAASLWCCRGGTNQQLNHSVKVRNHLVKFNGPFLDPYFMNIYRIYECTFNLALSIICVYISPSGYQNASSLLCFELEYARMHWPSRVLFLFHIILPWAKTHREWIVGFIKLEFLASTIFTAVMKQRQVGHTSREFILIKNLVFLSLRSIKCEEKIMGKECKNHSVCLIVQAFAGKIK